MCMYSSSSPSLPKMTTRTVNVNRMAVKTTVTDGESFKDSYITELILSCNYNNNGGPIIVGVDVNLKQPINNLDIATLQLSSKSYCLVIQLHNMKSAPQSLKDFLMSPLFGFVGVWTVVINEELQRRYGLAFRNAMDLGPLMELGMHIGVVKLVPKASGDFGAKRLTKEQIESAVKGAHIISLLGDHLL